MFLCLLHLCDYCVRGFFFSVASSGCISVGSCLDHCKFSVLASKILMDNG